MRRIFYAFCFLFLIFQAFPAYAQWEPVTIPGDESINQIERSAQYWYGLGDRNLYRSANDGLNWEKIRGEVTTDYFFNEQDTLYLMSSSYGLLKSTDGGENWSTLSGPFTLNLSNGDIASGGQYLYICASGKLYRFNKNMIGAPAALIYQSSGFYSAQSKVAASGSEIFYSVNDSLLYSNDAGNSWSLLHKGFFARGIAYHADTIVITSIEKTHRSVNKGQSWESFTQYFDYQNVIYVDGMWQTFVSGSNIMLTSHNGGADWQPLTAPMNNGIRNVRKKGQLIIGNSNEGVIRSTDSGQHWERILSGFETLWLSSITEGPQEIGGLLRVNGAYSSDEGLTWVRPVPDQGGYFSFPMEHKGVFFQIGSDKRLYKSNNLLRNWNMTSPQIHNDPYQLISTGDNLYLLSFNPQVQDSLLLFESKDMGESWQPTGGSIHKSAILHLTAHQGYLYLLSSSSKLHRSIDGGAHWEFLSNVPFNGTSFSTYFQSLHGVLFILSYTEILFSVDNGLSFIKLNNTPQGIPGWGNIAYDGTYLVAGNYFSVMLSKGVGTNNWINIKENLPAGLNYNELIFAIHKGYVYVGDQGQLHLFRRKLSPLQTAQLSGEVYQDDNNNGLKDPGEAPLGGIYLKAGNGSYTTTKPDGTFSFNAYLDRDTVQALAPKSWMKVNPEKRFVQGDQSGLQFGIYSPPGIFDFSCVATNGQVFRSGFQQNVFLNWQHNGTATGNGVLQCVLSAPLQFLSATITPDQIKGDTLIWNLLNIQGKSSGVVTLEVLTPVGTPLGTPVRISAVINPLIGNDAYPSDNQFELYTEVLGAYDPNDKQCEPTHFTLQDLDIPPPLTYTIRFQNEGNFPAEFVRILDTLDYAYLDVATFQVLASSHPCDTRITDKGIVEFYFADIQLPAKSSDEAGSQGFIKYSIQPKRGLPTWVNIRNRAHIFFDFNEAVVTNTTETGVQLPVWVRDVANPDLRLKAWPNPSGGVVLLAVPESSGVLRLFDAYGHLLEQRLVTKTEEQFDLSAYPAGTYRAIWTGDKGDVVRSVLLVKQ